MNAPDGAESAKDRDHDEGITLPSWIDAAIAKTRSDEASPEAAEVPYQHEAASEAAYESSEATAEATAEESPEFESAEYEVIEYETLEPAGDDEEYSAQDPDDPSHRDEYGTPRSHLRLVESAPEMQSGEFAENAVAEEDESYESAAAAAAGNEPFPSFLDRRPSLSLAPDPQPEPSEAAAPDPRDEIDELRARIVSEALAEPEPEPAVETALRADPIPLPVAPIRRRAGSGPWLMAAIFFAAAAIVLAVLIWLRPLPQ